MTEKVKNDERKKISCGVALLYIFLVSLIGVLTCWLAVLLIDPQKWEFVCETMFSDGNGLRVDNLNRAKTGFQVVVFATQDGGQHWTELTRYPEPSRSKTLNENCLYLNADQTLIFPSDRIILLSADGGKTWQEQQTYDVLLSLVEPQPYLDEAYA